MSSLADKLHDFLQQPIDLNLLSDSGNTPFVSFTFISDTNNQMHELSFGGFLNINREPKTSRIPSTYGLVGCVGLCKIIQGTFLDQMSRSNDDPDPIHTDYGHCDLIRLNECVTIIVSIIASPQDSHFFYTYFKNQIEILHQEYV